MPLRVLPLFLLAAPSLSIIIRVFSDPSCTTSIGNSSVYQAWAGVCNTAFTPDSGFAIGLDFCSPLRVTLSVFSDPSAGAAEVWGGAVTCTGPANASVSLAESVCTRVQPCAACTEQYFLLTDTQCAAPVPSLILQHDRGEITPGGVQGCQSPLGANAGQRFQSREVLLGVCNGRTITRTPDQVPNSNSNCGNSISACSRLDINALSILPVQTSEGLDISTFFADACASAELPVTWVSVPVQDKNSLFCRVQREWNVGVLPSYARHGVRVYAPQAYPTALSESPTPSVSPSVTATAAPASPSPLVTATAAPATPAPPPAAFAAPADAVSRAEFAGISAAVLILLAALGAGLVVLLRKLQAIQRLALAREWQKQQPQAVEMVNALHTVRSQE